MNIGLKRQASHGYSQAQLNYNALQHKYTIKKTGRKSDLIAVYFALKFRQ